MTKVTTPRIPTVERREQIVAAALGLLADTSIEALTTRDLAAVLGLTQPALFRHFKNREALLVGVVGHARSELEKIALGILSSGAPSVEQLQALGQSLLVHAERHPGLPRLLFATTTDSPGEVREALRDLVMMQRSFVSELVRRGQREGDLEPGLDASAAALLFVGMLQGLVLRWELGGRRDSLPAPFGDVFTLWLHGAARRPGAPEGLSPVVVEGARRAQASASAREPASARGFAKLDVRPLLARGVDPLAEILALVASLEAGTVLIIEAPFRPGPLLALLARDGHGVECEPLAADHWLVEVVVGASGPGAQAPTALGIEDLRALPPPGPLERVLAAVEELSEGGLYLARLPRTPRLLLPHLARPGLSFELAQRPDGAVLLRVAKARSPGHEAASA